MALKEDLNTEVANIFKSLWSERKGTVVPTDNSLRLGNDCIKINATVLYADLAESTALVEEQSSEFAAEIYKTYLHCASKIIRAEGGEITAFDGDRVMGVFIGNTKNTSAVRCALKINYAVHEIINPAIKKQYNNSYTVKHAVGVDTSDLLVARTGIRGSNDLVWVGRAANYAAKLCSLREASYSTWITKDVFDTMLDTVKKGGDPKQSMWEKRFWTSKKIDVYRSSWHWKV